MKFYKYLIVFSFLLSLTTFVVGCGDGDSSGADSDSVLSGENDPALDESNTDPSGGGAAGGDKGEGGKADGNKADGDK